MGDLEPLRPELDGKLDIAADIVDVLAVDGRVDGQRQAKLGYPAGDVELFLRRAGISADPLGILGIDVLERDLDVIEPALGEVFEAGAIECNRGGDQVAVEAGLRSGR